jgi:hypothetical protein
MIGWLLTLWLAACATVPVTLKQSMPPDAGLVSQDVDAIQAGMQRAQDRAQNRIGTGAPTNR